ncbi:MAG: retropepsin-like aspartic protease [Endomicrobiaceae bacterium]
MLIVCIFLTCSSFADIKNSEIERQSVIIPIELNGKMKGMPIVNVTVNGQVLHLALDTGADNVFIALTPEALAKTEIKTSKEIKKNLDVNGQLYKSHSAQVSEIKIGNLSFNNITVFEELRKTDDGSEGIIGNKLFDKFNILIDYKESRIILYSNISLPSFVDLNKWLKIPFKHEDIGIIIEGFSEKQKKNFRFCLDSGAVAVNEKGKAFDLLKSTALVSIKQTDNEKTYSDNIIINKKNIFPMNFYLFDFAKPDVDGFLGYAFLSEYKIFIDFKKELIYIEN